MSWILRTIISFGTNTSAVTTTDSNGLGGLVGVLSSLDEKLTLFFWHFVCFLKERKNRFDLGEGVWMKGMKEGRKAHVWSRTASPMTNWVEGHVTEQAMFEASYNSILRPHTGTSVLDLQIVYVKKKLVNKSSWSTTWLPQQYVGIRQHTSAYVSIRQHTSAYVSQHVTRKEAE